MSCVSEAQKGNISISASESPAVEIQNPEKPPSEISGYKPVLKKHEALKKCLDPISGNFQSQVWMSPELLVYSNSEYVYSTFTIALSLFWGKGGKAICLSRPSSVIFYNSLALAKYNGYK